MEKNEVLVIDGKALDNVRDIARRLFVEDRHPERIEIILKALQIYIAGKGYNPGFEVRL